MTLRDAATLADALASGDESAWTIASFEDRMLVLQALRALAKRPCRAEILGAIQDADEDIAFPAARAAADAIFALLTGRNEETAF
ncbi:hypothetical protein QNA08_01505 [Chelatococcus sp. SYSU_G07232]|uniref:HEAT repeat domain-containing protein n=1 Tax=Chelatococcus albus TaxID=3047466 RepID=A0ABT7AC33_9HYPH|nr:hypothetical protein [Chelatococcus sp. SYSU_G07232]MDJ1156919.1 hypothetical protein [Chelatococcus sp. SYSU_G07232]